MPAAASRADVVRLRLQAQGLAGVPLPGAVAVAERMLAVQAQDYPAAQWALGVRSPGTTLHDVQALISAGEIVRSWPMRGTLHFVPARELGWIQSLTTPRLLAKTRTTNERLGLDPAVLELAREAAIAARTRAAKTQRGLGQAVQDYARFLGVPMRQTLEADAPASA
ncbi:DNA glycosylase AlkZ-like family protein [Cryobacterium lyxosi]|uniref:Winged helix DNA-binding domain-containing protein n=1 Tax=Cryobacterium lyxosi TaxID=1259228 RepID=A0A4R8ZEE8_9MICO|nr:crosslink repair DNA glycosylase YcaQ family protein [Cryobacterium lyxosi]TFD25838.1 hypothetical protein E3T27_08480 [Cryobacterium lyxosi]